LHCVVIGALLSLIEGRGAAVKIAIIFPEELLKFWPAFIQEAVRGRQQGATSSRF
jgi:hypothetical protein